MKEDWCSKRFLEQLVDYKADRIPGFIWCASVGQLVDCGRLGSEVDKWATLERLADLKPRRLYGLAKRVLDVFLAATGLLLCLPLFAVVAVAIKADSPGPVIFKQVRIGQNRRRAQRRNGHLFDRRNGDLKGKPFTIYKFRTMYVNVDDYDWRPKGNGDPRVTRVGRVLRRLCIDELPQLVNVLKGEMSIVGPRPELPPIVQEYNSLEEQRLNVKPGITGLWQLKGPRNERIHDNIHLDLNYLWRRSFWLDLAIIARTLLFVVRLKNV
ncbi:MAG: sugar transferase [candidate division KSB1 bacterium]|nr:sugar transferase [candidate division KSB1 bacterium]